MTQLLSGFGRPVFKNLGKTIPQLLFTEPLAFKINNSSNEVVSYKQVDGYQVVAGAKQNRNENTAAITIEAASIEALQLAFGIEAAVSASVDLAELRFRTLPLTGGTYEIVDADLATAVGGIQASVVDNGTWGKSGNLTQFVGAGAPGVGQFKVDVPGSKLIFNAASAGAPIAYTLIKNYTGLRTLGREASAGRLNSISFEGVAYTEDDKQVYKILIPKMVRTKSTSLDLGEKTALELEYRMIVPPGSASDYQLIEMPVGWNAG